MKRAPARIVGLRLAWIGAVVLAVVACAEPLKIGAPVFLDPGSPTPTVRNLRAALVRPAQVTARWGADLPGLDTRVARSLTDGLASVTRWLVRDVVIVDAAPSSGYDVVIVPNNVVIETDRSTRVDISMDVTVRRLRDGKEFGLLIEGVEGPGGKRPYSEWKSENGVVRTLGSPLPNPPLGRAIHNAMFVTCMDYARKLERRLASML